MCTLYHVFSCNALYSCCLFPLLNQPCPSDQQTTDRWSPCWYANKVSTTTQPLFNKTRNKKISIRNGAFPFLFSFDVTDDRREDHSAGPDWPRQRSRLSIKRCSQSASVKEGTPTTYLLLCRYTIYVDNNKINNTCIHLFGQPTSAQYDCSGLTNNDKTNNSMIGTYRDVWIIGEIQTWVL